MPTLQFGRSFPRLVVWTFVTLIASGAAGRLEAQQIDVLLKGGHVIDPRNGIDSPMDVAIADGRILQVSPDISTNNARRVVDVSGFYVTPGVVDLHMHVLSVAPDGFTFRSGVTTVVDAGSTGWKGFDRVLEVIESSQTRIFAFLSVVGDWGQGGTSQDLHDMEPDRIVAKIREYPDIILGIKTWKTPDFRGIDRALEAGRMADVPIMSDFGEHDPRLSLETLLMEKFRPGDIFTHVFSYQIRADRPTWGRETVVDENLKVKPFVRAAQEKGVIFDVGHGGGSLLWHQAIPAIEQGFFPNTISSDLFRASMNAGMKDQANVMSKFLNIGMTLSQVIEASTWNPAQVIGREEVGHLSVGADADVAVFNLREGDFGFVDARGRALRGTRKLEAELTIRGGRIVWDLNGISVPMWDEEPRFY